MGLDCFGSPTTVATVPHFNIKSIRSLICEEFCSVSVPLRALSTAEADILLVLILFLYCCAIELLLLSTPNQKGHSKCSNLSTPASSIIILSNLIRGGSFLRDRFVDIIIFFSCISLADLLKGIGIEGSTPVGFPVLRQSFFATSGPSILHSSQQNSLAAALVYATSKTLLDRASAIILIANPLPRVVFPQPGGPTTAAISLLDARQFNTLNCSESRERLIAITTKIVGWQ